MDSRRVCLVVDDDPSMLSMVVAMLNFVFNQGIGARASEVSVLRASSFQGAAEQIRQLSVSGDKVRLVLVTDNDLGDGTGVDLTTRVRDAAFAASWSMLQSGSARAELEQKYPIVKTLPEECFAQKPVPVKRYLERLPYMCSVWDL